MTQPDESKLSPAMRAAQRMARARAALPPVNNQGKPQGPPATLTYDADGRLIKAEPGTPPDPA